MTRRSRLTAGVSTTDARNLLRPGLAALSYGEHLAKSRVLLNACRTRTFRVMGCGNSINFGCWSTGSVVSLADPALAAPIRSGGFIAQLRRDLNAAYGTTSPGEGLVINSDARVTQSGAQAIQSLGVTKNYGYRLHEASDHVTLTTLAGDTSTICDVHFTHGNHTQYGPFRYQINGGAEQVVTDLVTSSPGTNASVLPMYTGAASNNFESVGTYRITGLTPGANVIKVMPEDTGAYFFDHAGWSLWDRDPAAPPYGIAVNQESASGGYLDTTIYPVSSSLVGYSSSAQPRSNMLTHGRAAPDLLLLSWGANEYSTTGEGLGETPALYRALLNDYVTWCTSDYVNPTYSMFPKTSAAGGSFQYSGTKGIGCDVLLISTGRRQPPVATYGMDVFAQIHEDLAASNPRVAHLDLGRVWGDWANADATERMFDEVHPNAIGHADMAKMITEVLVGV